MKSGSVIAWVLAAVAVALPARADEGMWTFNHPPTKRLQQGYGFTPSPKWLDHVRLSSVRLAGGCSGSFVSPNGLVMTNHHCAHSCIQQLSTAERDYVKSGFYAKEAGDEVKCPDIEVNQLTGITDVTARVDAATRGLSGEKYAEALRAVTAGIEKECAGGDAQASDRRCDVVSLYHGGRYDLYQYRRYQDVRLVFAPEFAAAFFGGDPDNFEFPRYDLDVSFLRVYQDGKPARIADWFPFSPTGAKDGELSFVTGHPGRTDRQLTLAELTYQRDVALPDRVLMLAELRGALAEYSRRGAEEQRTAQSTLFYIENGYKVLRGRFAMLLDPKLIEAKAAEEKALRARVAKSPKLRKATDGAWDEIAKALERQKALRVRLAYLDQGYLAMRGDLFGIARTLVQGTVERGKANGERYDEYRDSALPAVMQRLYSSAPIYPGLEELKLRFGLTKLRELLGPDDPIVKQVLGKDSPEAVARRLVEGSKLGDVAPRRQLWEGGPAAVAASQDPMIAFVRSLDPAARQIRKQYEEEVESVLRKNDERIARARFALDGTDAYPDATFTLRLSYGQVKGWQEQDHFVKPFTDFAGAFARATGAPPFELPQSWIDAKRDGRLRLDTPLDLCTTNDIIGGNSGSPVIDREARVIGLIFDGNIESLGGNYGYDGSVNRAVAVDSRALVEALNHIYKADRLVRELHEAQGTSAGPTQSGVTTEGR